MYLILQCHVSTIYIVSLTYITSTFSCLNNKDNESDGTNFSASHVKVKDEDWNTYTCTYGWNVQGIWKRLPSMTKESTNPLQQQQQRKCNVIMNTADPICVDRSNSSLLAAVGDVEGNIKLFNYPVVGNEKSCSGTCAYHYHTGHVSKCRFSCDDSILVTTGKEDRAILVWKVVRK